MLTQTAIPVKSVILWSSYVLFFVGFAFTPSLVAQTEGEEEQEEFEIHPTQFFIEAEALAEDDSLEAYLDEINATVAWSEEGYPVELWEVTTNYPYETATGDTILSILDALNLTRKKSKIKSVCFNRELAINSLSMSGTMPSCFKISDFTMDQGDHPIKISIIDTGIDQNIGQASNDSMNFDLIEYTGYDYVNDDAIPEDENGHGTHLAGLIHAITQAGLTGDNRITFDIRKTHDAQGDAFMSDVVIAVFDAISSGADIINMSFGYQDIYSDTMFFPLRVAMEEAALNNALLIAASGNSSSDNDNYSQTILPASFPDENLISVSAVSCQNELSSFANFGATSVDVAILGENIPGPGLEGNIIWGTGTSQATAIVTAISALKATNHELEPDQLKCQLIQSAKHVTTLIDRNVADGRIDLNTFMSLNSCLEKNCDQSFVEETALTGIAPNAQILEINGAIQSSQVIPVLSDNSYDAALGVELLSGFSVSESGRFLISTSGCNSQF